MHARVHHACIWTPFNNEPIGNALMRDKALLEKASYKSLTNEIVMPKTSNFVSKVIAFLQKIA